MILYTIYPLNFIMYKSPTIYIVYTGTRSYHKTTKIQDKSTFNYFIGFFHLIIYWPSIY